MKQGGLAPGGLNFDCKVRRESTDLEDIFIGHIGSMDAFAAGLLVADKMIRAGEIPRMIQDRYSSWDSGLGAKVEANQSTMEEVAEYATKNPARTTSGKKEKYEVILNQYLFNL